MLPLLNSSLPSREATLGQASACQMRGCAGRGNRAHVEQSELAWPKPSGEADTVIPMHARPGSLSDLPTQPPSSPKPLVQLRFQPDSFHWPKQSSNG